MTAPAQRTAHHQVTALPEACATCGRMIDTPFCPSCGEQRASDRHYTLRHFGEELLETVAHADGRAVRTLRALVAAPGALTAAYMRGARLPYLVPLQLFFLVNVVFFVWVGITHMNTFGTPLQFHVQGMFYSGVASRMVTARLVARHVTYDAYADRFDHAAMLQAKSLIILMVPLLAAVTALITLPRREHPVRHVVFALHAMAAILLIIMVTALVVGFATDVYAAAAHARPRWQTLDQLSTLLMLLLVGAYVRAALRRAYAFGPVSAAARALLFVIAFVPAVFCYRAVLFFTTFYST